MDIVSPATRSRMMAGIRSSGTRPEIFVRKLLHAQGFRYRLKTKILNCYPDIVLPKYRVVIFVHGCFWHQHPGCKYATTPKTHSEKWQYKFKENVQRDNRIEKTFLAAGWHVAVIWECWIKRKLDISWLYPWITSPTSNIISWPEANDRLPNNAGHD